MRSGGNSEHQLFWLVTALISGWMLTTVITDLILHWRDIVHAPLELVATIIGAALALTFFVAPIVMKLQFPRWCGAVGYFAALILLGNNIFYVGDAVLATTALHILPVLGMYLGWFWDFRSSIVMFALSLVIVLTASFFSPLVGQGRLLTYMVAIFTIVLMAIAYGMSAYLSRDLTHAASTDNLTGALNTWGLRIRLAHELARARRRTEPLAVAVTDFDGFKLLNDQFGHHYGDNVLRENAQLWMSNLRIYDVVGRLGGDEFVLIFPRTRTAQARKVLERLQTISTHTWSWGLAQQRPEDTVDSIIARADERLYDRKQQAPAHMATDERRDVQPRVEAQRRVAGQQPPRQTPFSIMTATLGLMVIIPVLVGFVMGELNPISNISPVLWGAIGVGALLCVTALSLGERLPMSFSIWAGGAILCVYIVFAFNVDLIMRGVGILFAMSALALYLGTFSGTHRARLGLLVGVALVSAPLLLQGLQHGDDTEQAVSITAVVYTFSVCFVLFELSSYLYNRSRILVEHDSLTGALNRHGLSEYGEAEFSRAERGEYPLTAIMLDCIDFKHINDTQGHLAGDRMLKQVATHLIDRISPDDVLVRLGGDEFLLLVPYLEEGQVQEYVERLLADAPMKMYVGVAGHQPGDTLEELIERADLRMYSA